MADTTERVTKLLVDHLGVDETKVTPEALLVDDLGADSLDIVEIALAVEEAFDIEIPDDVIRAKPDCTVADFVRMVEERRG